MDEDNFLNRRQNSSANKGVSRITGSQGTRGTGTGRTTGSQGTRGTGTGRTTGSQGTRGTGTGRTTGSQGTRGTGTGRTTGSQTSGVRRTAGSQVRSSGRAASNPGRGPEQGRRNDRRELEMRKRQIRKKRNMTLLAGLGIIAILITIAICYIVIRTLGSSNNSNEGTKVAGSVTGGVTDNTGNGEGDSDSDTPVAVSPTATPTPTIEPTSVKIFSCGDDLIHAGVYNSGLQDDGSHDYTFLYDNISTYLEESDLKIINQETILGGDDLGLQSYPLFNSPTAIGDALVSVGFNVILHASNHAYDMGLDGLLNCVSFWRTNYPDITMLGIHEDASEQDEITVVEVNGIKFALLNYTYSHNWETFSSSAEGHLDMLCAYDEDTRTIDFDTINPKVISDIEKAEELADFTIVFPHWGTEYVTSATEQEVNFAKLMTEAGADLIIGTHPHVIQPVEWITSDNGNTCLCYYSLGNFTSTQDRWDALMGGLASLTVIKDSTGVYIDEESIKAIPIVTQYKYPGYTGGAIVTGNYLLKDYTDEMAAAHGVTPRFGVTVSRDKMVDLAQSVFGDYFSWD